MALALIPAAESKEKRMDTPHNMGESRSMMFSEKPPPLMAATLHSEGPNTTCVPICCSVVSGHSTVREIKGEDTCFTC